MSSSMPSVASPEPAEELHHNNEPLAPILPAGPWTQRNPLHLNDRHHKPSCTATNPCLRCKLTSSLIVLVAPNICIFLTYLYTAEALFAGQLVATINVFLVLLFRSALRVPDLGRTLNEKVVRRVCHDGAKEGESSGETNMSGAAADLNVNMKDKREGTNVDEGKKDKVPSDTDSGVDVQDTPQPSATSIDPNHQRANNLLKEFLGVVSDSSSIPWLPVYEEPDLTIVKHPTVGHFYKITVFLRLPYKPALFTVFDFLADIDRRPEWDNLCVTAYTVRRLDKWNRVTYFRNKGVMLTAARDAVLFSHCRKVGQNKLANVTMSTLDETVGKVPQGGTVRMEVGMAGQVCEVAGDWGEDGQVIKLIQVVNGDPKGNLPAMAVNYVATKALPRAWRNVRAQLQKAQPRLSSQFLPSDEDFPEDPTGSSASQPPVSAPPPVKPPPSSIQVALGPHPPSPAHPTVPVPKPTSTTTSVRPENVEDKDVPVHTKLFTAIYKKLTWAQPFTTTAVLVTIIVILLKRKSTGRWIAREVLKGLRHGVSEVQ